MPESGRIEFKNLKGRYHVPDIVFIDSREIDNANEFRLTFEISFGIGLTLLGSVISDPNWPIGIVCGVFLVFGAISLCRYLAKNKQVKKAATANSGLSD